MIASPFRIAALLICLAIAACGSTATPAIAGSLFAEAPDPPRYLPDRLREVSGLAVSPEGRLFGHDDEIGVIYQINPADGQIVKWFAVGERIVTGDFEGLTITPAGVFWLTTSTGKVYQFREGADTEHVAYQRFDTGVEDNCEVEGVTYLASSESLILACKRGYGRGMEDVAALRIWSIGGGAATVWGDTRRTYAAAADVSRFEPSDIAIDPITGRILLLSSHSAALVELSPAGEILSGRSLGDRHQQAEGAVVLPDGSLAIADEGRNDQALLSNYARIP
jgi:uncharacterized protein YjiK